MSKFGLVISVYDKFDDLLILLELTKLSKLFHKVIVSISEDAPIDLIDQKLKKYDIEILKTKTCKFVPPSQDYFKHMVSMTSRVWLTQREALKRLSDDCDYIMHTHSDGWFLNFKKLEELFEEMIESDKDFYYRGVGITKPYFPGAPIGSLDDHFYIITSSAIKESQLMKREIYDCLPGYFNIHGLLSSLLVNDIGISKSKHYDDGKSWKSWDETNVKFLEANPLRPFVFNTQYGLLHCHVEDFPESMGRSLQANYLKRFQLDLESDSIRNFCDKHHDDNIDKKLKSYEGNLRKKLNMFLAFDHRNNNLSFLENDLSKYKSNPLKYFFYNFAKLIFKRFTNNKYGIAKKNILYPLLIDELYKEKIKPIIEDVE